MDANGRPCYDENDQQLNEPCKSIGVSAKQNENRNGVVLKGFLQAVGFAAVNTHFNCAPAFYGQSWQSTVDYICTPKVVLEQCRIKYVRTMTYKGDPLQAFGEFERAEYRHVSCMMSLELSYDGRSKQHLFDLNKIMKCYYHGVGKQDFLDRVGVEMDSAGFWEIWNNGMRIGNPSQLYNAIARAVIKVGDDMFSPKRPEAQKKAFQNRNYKKGARSKRI